MHFEYCPPCGSHLQPKPAGDEGPVPFCPVCQRYWFDFFYSCIIILLCNEQDEVVLCKQPHLSQEYESITSGFIMARYHSGVSGDSIRRYSPASLRP